MNPARLPIVFAALAIILWASLAMTASLLKGIPPFFQLAIAFGIGGVPSVLRLREAFTPWRTLLLGVAGFYGYHFFLFTAFKLSSPVTSNLINYLWPTLMVLMTPLFFKTEKLRWSHGLGALLTLGGVGLLLYFKGEFSPDSISGYLCALGAALTWPLYSLSKKKFPGGSVYLSAGTCLVSALLCLLTHMFTEASVTPTAIQWWLLLWLGVGPFGAAFFLWDKAVRVGDSRLIGALSYLTPVLSTLLLVFGAGAPADTVTWVALLMMSLGSVVGSLGKR